jgi:hypothetical protein
MAERSKALRFKLLLVFALLVVVAWSVLWFVAATIVDRHVQKAEMTALHAGMTANCLNRSVTGFPFRIEVRCDPGSRAGNRDATVTVGGATVAALVYDPDRVIAEVAGPVEIAADNAPPLRAEWSLAHASARLDFANQALERFDAEVKQARLHVGGRPPLHIGELGAHVRRDPEARSDLGLAVRFSQVEVVEGQPPASFSFRGRLGEGAPLLAGRPRALLDALASGGVPLVIEAATFESGGMEMEATGEVVLGADGRLNGTVDVAIAGQENGVPYISQLAPQAAETVSKVMNNVLAFAPETAIGERPARKLSLVINDSTVRAGIVPLFTLPPVTFAPR